MMGASCNECGACCDPVVSPVSPQQLTNGVVDEVFGPQQARWMRDHLTPIRPRREGLAKVRDWNSGMTEWLLRGEPVILLSWFYRCDLFDEDTRRCIDWDHRPAMCRGYPWYDDGPDERKALPPTCSYREDIGQPVEISAVTRQGPGRDAAP